jgi:hypothetical protein
MGVDASIRMSVARYLEDVLLREHAVDLLDSMLRQEFGIVAWSFHA